MLNKLVICPFDFELGLPIYIVNGKLRHNVDLWLNILRIVFNVFTICLKPKSKPSISADNLEILKIWLF